MVNLARSIEETNEYIVNYTPEYKPNRLPLLAAMSGWGIPARIENACELGFGFGFTPLLYSAAGTATWWGNDFNSSQVYFARKLATEAGLTVHFSDESFYDFCSRTDLPQFDLIVLHGVWSWISDENRSIIINFIKKHLQVGGMVYFGYNVLPAHAQMIPFRRVMQSHFNSLSGTAFSSEERTGKTISFIQRLFAENPQLGALYPLAKTAVENLTSNNPMYVLHEYLCANWNPMSFLEFHELVEKAKISFVCSAVSSQNDDHFFLIDHQKEFLRQIPDFVTREATRDLLVNRRFRQDIWIKGGERLSQNERNRIIDQTLIIPGKNLDQVKLTVKEAPLNNLLDQSQVNAVFAAFVDSAPKKIEEIYTLVRDKFAEKKDFFRTVLTLEGNGSLAIAQNENTSVIEERSRNFNRAIMRRAFSGTEPGSYLASPITGGGVAAARHQLQFMRVIEESGPDPELCAKEVWQDFKARDIVMVKDGTPLLSDADNLEEIKIQAQAFIDNDLPLFRKLKCI